MDPEVECFLFVFAVVVVVFVFVVVVFGVVVRAKAVSHGSTCPQWTKISRRSTQCMPLIFLEHYNGYNNNMHVYILLIIAPSRLGYIQ